jgi:hypothetical protein
MGETQASRAEARRRAAERRHDELGAFRLRLESGARVSESDVEQEAGREQGYLENSPTPGA